MVPIEALNVIKDLNSVHVKNRLAPIIDTPKPPYSTEPSYEFVAIDRFIFESWDMETMLPYQRALYLSNEFPWFEN